MSASPSLPWDPGEFRDPLHQLARGMLHGQQVNNDASDLVQETMVAAVRGLDQCRATEPSQRFAWLAAILSNLVCQRYRYDKAQKRAQDREINLDASAANLEAWLVADQTSPSEAARLDERATRLAQALERLPEEQRRAVALHGTVRERGDFEMGVHLRLDPAQFAALFQICYPLPQVSISHRSVFTFLPDDAANR